MTMPGAQAEVSENSVGEAVVSGTLCQREPELVCCGTVESPLDSAQDSIFPFDKQHRVARPCQQLKMAIPANTRVRFM